MVLPGLDMEILLVLLGGTSWHVVTVYHEATALVFVVLPGTRVARKILPRAVTAVVHLDLMMATLERLVTVIFLALPLQPVSLPRHYP